jgi:hypothetical protein
LFEEGACLGRNRRAKTNRQNITICKNAIGEQQFSAKLEKAASIYRSRPT